HTAFHLQEEKLPTPVSGISHVHTHTRTHAPHAHTHARTHARTHTHTNTRTHTHTHTHTHTLVHNIPAQNNKYPPTHNCNPPSEKDPAKMVHQENTLHLMA